MAECYAHVRPHPVHNKHRWHVDPPDVDLHVSWALWWHVLVPDGSEKHVQFVGEGPCTFGLDDILPERGARAVRSEHDSPSTKLPC